MDNIVSLVLNALDTLLSKVGLVRIAHYDANLRAYMLSIQPKERTCDVCDTSEDAKDLFI